MILSLDLVLKDIDHEVLARQHVLKVAGQCVEAVVRAALRLFFVDRHSALVARVSSLALVLLVLHDAQALHLLVAVDARDHYVRAGCLVQIYVLPERLCLALGEGLALHRLELAFVLMRERLLVRQRRHAAELPVLALEFHCVKLLLDLFANIDEARLLALEWTLACLSCKFVEAHLVEPILAFLALPRVF